MRRLLSVLLVAGIALFGRTAFAADALPQEFYGNFAGLGLSETMTDGKIVEVKPRDFDVTIGKSPDGFTLSWKTTEYTIKPRSSRLNAADEAIVFVKSERDGLFAPASPGNVANGDALYWARLSGNTLDVYSMAVNEKGQYEIAVWQRVVNGDRMELTFTRTGNTMPPRTVKGSLSRVKP